MDVLLGRLTSQAMNYAIRSGIAVTTTYALKQCTRLLKETTIDSHKRQELIQLQHRLESKIRILSPSIDMIELISARGNTTLESAVTLTKSIRLDIQKLGIKVASAAEDEQSARRNGSQKPNSSRTNSDRALDRIIFDIKALLINIEDAIPLINLAITTSGVSLSTKLSGTISPSRLLQASTFLSAADAGYTARPGSRQQVGPTWTLSLYMLFAGHANRMNGQDGIREATWKEVIHKAGLRIVRVPVECLYDCPGESKPDCTNVRANTIPADVPANEFAYQLVLVEDLDDGRVHTFEDHEAEQSVSAEDLAHAGIRDVVPIHEISKVFYTDTGKILNIGGDDESNNPVLLMKRDVHAEPPRRMLERSQSQMSIRSPSHFDAAQRSPTVQYCDENDEQSEIDDQLFRESTPHTLHCEAEGAAHAGARWRLPVDLDPEWMALEVYVEEYDSESDQEDQLVQSQVTSTTREASLGPELTSAMSYMKLASRSPDPKAEQAKPLERSEVSPMHRSEAGPRIKTSLSLLEILIKLTALQQFRQDSHLAIEDELLNFFLEDTATAGAGPDRECRHRLRHDAVRRVGFDPYDESPIKRRGEEYIAHKRGKASPRVEFDVNAFSRRSGCGNGFAHNRSVLSPESVQPSVEELPSSPFGRSNCSGSPTIRWRSEAERSGVAESSQKRSPKGPTTQS